MRLLGFTDIKLYFFKDINLIFTIIHIFLFAFLLFLYLRYFIIDFIGKIRTPKKIHSKNIINKIAGFLPDFYKEILIIIFIISYLISLAGIGNIFIFSLLEIVPRSIGLSLFIFGLLVQSISRYKIENMEKQGKILLESIYYNRNKKSEVIDFNTGYIQFELVRFPLESAEILIFSGIAISLMSVHSLIISLIISLVNIIRIRRIDNFVGAISLDYYNYQALTGRIVPKIKAILKKWHNK